MTNLIWDESKVNREASGQFGEKNGLPSGVSLAPAPPSRQDSYTEDTIDELFTQVAWHTDGSFDANFGGESYHVKPSPSGVTVTDTRNNVLSASHPVQRVAEISIGRFGDENPLPPVPVETRYGDEETYVGGLYGGWERADVIASRVSNRIEEAVQAGHLPPFEYNVVPTGIGSESQNVNVFISAEEGELMQDGQWTNAASHAYHGALRIVDAWNMRSKAGPWAPQFQTYGSNVRIKALTH